MACSEQIDAGVCFLQRGKGVQIKALAAPCIRVAYRAKEKHCDRCAGSNHRPIKLPRRGFAHLFCDLCHALSLDFCERAENRFRQRINPFRIAASLRASMIFGKDVFFLSADPGQRFNNIRAADKADEFAVSDDRHALDAVMHKKSSDIGN
jgi:hypothetical protein